MNPPQAAQESNDMVKIYCREKDQYSFASHLSAALRREGISVSVDNNSSFSGNPKISLVFTPIIMDRYYACKRIFIGVCDNRVNFVPIVMDQEVSIALPCTHGRIRYMVGQNQPSCISYISILTDSELVDKMVKDVYEKLYSAERVGIYSRLLEIEKLLYNQRRDIQSLGIWGMPGIGKTTLAKAVFGHMSTDYDATCFIENFDDAFHKEGLHRLLAEKMGKILKEEFDIKSSYILRPSLLREKLGDKRILLVLDDVRDSLAAESFLGRLDWFGQGSLIIMTSIDKQVFPFCNINQIYEVQGLKEDEAWKLFYQNAFGKDDSEGIRELSRNVIDYANGNPLALCIYGQEHKGKKSEMESAFLTIKHYPPQKIQDNLKSVYSALADNEKNIVLDIASFFKGENVNYAVQMLEGCRYLPRLVIDVLVDKCVLTISENTVQMSSIIQDICQVIFNGEIERCTRLCEPYNIKCLLEDDDHKASGECSMTPKRGQVVEDIESIILDTSNLKFDVKHDAFKDMFNLRFLKIHNSCSKYVYGLSFPKGLDSLPCGLRLLHWENYPLQSLPQDFDLDNLVDLYMPYSQLQTLGTRTKKLKMLRRIRLCHSQQLVEFDLLLNAQNIEIIDLQGCIRLQSFQDTSELQHLRVVNLSGCTEIKSFQGAPPNIEELHLQGTSIREIPMFIVSQSPGKVKLVRQKLLNLLENFQDVEHIEFESVSDLVKESSYNQGFGKLVHLNMKDCSYLQSLPDMANLESLKFLYLSGCSELKEIKGFPKNMRKLYIGGTAIRQVPRLPKSLEFLNAHGCTHLKSVCLDFDQLPRHYTFSNCFNFSSQVIAEFLKKDLTRVASIAKTQQQELIKAHAVRICIPADARQRSSFLLQGGPSAMIDLAPWTLKRHSGVAMTVVVSFHNDYHNVVGLGIRCICTWQYGDRELYKAETLSQCWDPTEAPKVEWDHIFIFYATVMHPKGIERFPNLSVKFEFHTVSLENKLLGDNCKVTSCGVKIIKAPTNDTTPSEIISEIEATSVIEEHDPPSSTPSRTILEAERPNTVSSSEPHKVSSAHSKLRSKGTMLWKWVKTIRRAKKKKKKTVNRPASEIPS